MNTEKCFYSVLKNEDATPYIGNNSLIVADGLGGAGSTVHNISPIEGATLHDEIFEAAFYDFDFEKARDMLEYLEHWVYPMADGKPDTSALWASRIAIARCAYALEYNPNFVNCDLSHIAVREQLARFISVGLNRTAEYFRLEKGKYDDQKVLPTTLAFVRYVTDEKGSTLAEVVWAGDSRCYLLTKDGLKQLSIDDEDKSGAITNLFFVGGRNATILNYRKYMINEPCVLMAVSDGIFDPFEPHDNISVEKTLLEHIEKNDSYENLMSSLSEFYDRVHSDDSTMAFVPIGFTNYEELRKILQDRTKFITEMWQKLYDMNAILEVANQSEVDMRSYIESRTRDKFQAIITTLLANDKDHSDDLAYTDEIINKITSIRDQLVNKRKRDSVSRIETAINTLRNHLKSHFEESLYDIFVRSLDDDVSDEISSLVYKTEREYRELDDVLKKKREVEMCVAKTAQWRSVIKEREEFYWNLFNEYRYDSYKTKQRAKIARVLKIWTYIDIQFEQGFYLFNEIRDLDNSDKKIAGEIKDYIHNNKQTLMMSPVKIEEMIANATEKYRATLDRLFDNLLKVPQICKKVFAERIIKQFALSETQEKQASIGGEDITSALIPQKDELSTAIVNALAKHYDKVSILDAYYNATRLNAFRAYYKTKASPNINVAEFKRQLQALGFEYNKLIAEQ